MMNYMKKFQLFFFLIAILFVSSCATVYYPTTLNTPLFDEQGEKFVDVSLNGGSIIFSGGYAMKEHFALAGQLSAYSVSSQIGQTTTGGEGVQLDITPGYFTSFGENGVFETYAGYGFGRITADDFDGGLHKFYLQPNIGYKGDNFHGAFSVRMMNVLFDARDPFFELGNAQYIEPAVSLKFGGERFMFTSQFGGSFPINADYEFEHFPFIVSIGGAYRF